MSALDTFGAIAAGIRDGRRTVDDRRRRQQDDEFRKTQQAYQTKVMERDTQRMEREDSLKEGMAKGMEEAQVQADAEAAQGTEYFAPGYGLSGAKTPQDADAYRRSVDAITAGIGQPQAPLVSPEIAAASGPAPAPALAAAARTGGKAPAMPDMSEATPTPERLRVPTREDGSVDIQELTRPKRTADALFYKGPWSTKLRADYLRAYGPEKTAEMDAKLKSAAEAGYKQRILEAAELQKAGDMRAVAYKLNEIYNRDYADGAFSNVRFIDEDRIEVVRFLPDGRIVDRTVQRMPDMITAARQLLTPEKRAELLVGGDRKASDITILQDADSGDAVGYNKVTGERDPIPGLKPSSMILGAENLNLRKQEAAERRADRAADNARADRAAEDRGKMTDAQIQAQKLRDAKIKTARKELTAWENERRAKGLPTRVMPGHPMEKTANLAKEPLSSEVE